jgi:hypothetical protein
MSQLKENLGVRKMPSQLINIYAGLTGLPIEVDRFDLGLGVVVERTFAHLMAPFMLAFAPAEPGKAHPAPWRASHGGLGFDMVVQLSNPASLESESPLGQQGTLWWVVALLRLRLGPHSRASSVKLSVW